MIPEIGHFSLLLALLLAFVQVGWAGYRNSAADAARALCLGQSFWITLSILCLLYAFLQDDFTVRYVAQHSNSALPLGYKLSALWSAHEGSILLWIWILSVWTVAVVLRGNALPPRVLTTTLAVLSLVQVGFLLFLLQTSDPFLRQWVSPPMDGQDLNPLLQDIGLIVHPPLLYLGYIGFAVPFAFAMALLLAGRREWHRLAWVRSYTVWAWFFLTLGIVLGSWWAYYELGWGGWWFWDPVENASLMPWLTGTALLHTFRLIKHQQRFYEWAFLLAIVTFSLSLLGTFLVRSGILTSVHSFASDPDRGHYLLVFLMITVCGGLGVFATRTLAVARVAAEPPQPMAVFSTEAFLLFQNVLLIVLCATVLLGTVFPIAYESVTQQKISVGFPYFNQVFVPLSGPLLFLMILAPHATWLKNGLHNQRARMVWSGLLSMATGVLVVYFFAPFEPGALPKIKVGVGVACGVWLTLSTLMASAAFRRHRLGMTVAHLGVALCVVGITVNTQYSIEKEVKIKPGDTLELAGHRVLFKSMALVEGSNYLSHQATFTVDGRVLHPEKRLFTAQWTAMTETAIDVTWLRDVYVALGESLESPYWSARVYYKPFVRWIWGGGVLMGLGGVLALRKRGRKQGESMC